MENMNMADKMAEGAVVSVMGFLIVFIVLLVIMGILSLFNLFAKYEKSKAETVVQTQNIPVAAQPQAPSDKDLTDDKQLVAVITAAIAAAMADETGEVKGTDGLVIKSIRRANAWNKEAISQNNSL